MLENLIYLLTALLGIITVFLIGFRFKTNRNTNFYLIVFFILSSFRFMVHGISNLPFFVRYHKHIEFFFIINAWPLLYLYFNNLIKNHNSLKRKELLHFFVPLVVFILFCCKASIKEDVFVIGQKIGFVVVVILNIIYSIISFQLLNEKVWKRKSEILVINQQNNNIKQWTLMLFSLFVLMLFRFFIGLAINQGDSSWYINQNNFLWVGALIWIVMYAKILYSPEFLYGYDNFTNKIKEYKKHTIIFDNIWIMEKTKEVTNVQDTVLKEKIEFEIEDYISSIENLAINTNLFSSESFTIADLANKLNIAKSHVSYVFKYHATISFVDFKKIIRIQKTILLIDKGYLKTNTLESLAAKTGFSSYSTFFMSFKSITGLSPQEYYKNQ